MIIINSPASFNSNQPHQLSDFDLFHLKDVLLFWKFYPQSSTSLRPILTTMFRFPRNFRKGLMLFMPTCWRLRTRNRRASVWSICHESNNLTTMPNFFVNYIQNTSKTSLSVIIDPIHIRFAMSYGIGCTWSSKSIKVAYNTCNVIELGSIQGEKIKYTNLTHKKIKSIQQ